MYKKPRVSHEICIDGTYTDLSLKEKYKGLRVGKAEMLSSIGKHLEEKGVLKKAPFYFKHSSEGEISFGIYVSHFDEKNIENGEVTVRFSDGTKTIQSEKILGVNEEKDV